MHFAPDCLIFLYVQGSDQQTGLRTLRELVYHKGRDIRIVDGKLMADSFVVNGDHSQPDRLKELCGGTATIFMGDERVSTNVLKDDGSRAVGTRIQGPAHDALFREWKPYRGEANILGTPYFAAYDPIKDASADAASQLSWVAEELQSVVGHFKVSA